MQTIYVRKISFTVTLLLGIFFANKIHANIIYVDSTSTGLNNGSSWTNAYTDLRAAITAANIGDSVWVAKGTYSYPYGFGQQFQMKNGVKIYGGFTGNETSFSARNWITNTTILKGNG